LDLNKCEIDKAFRQCPYSIILYVFGQQNGRFRNEDIIAFQALHNAYLFSRQSLVFVLNNLPVDRDSTYEGECIVFLMKLLDLAKTPNVCFLDQIDKCNEDRKAKLHRKLINVILSSAAPKEHEKQHDVRLQIDYIKRLIAENKRQTEEFNQEKHKLKEEIQNQQERYDAQLQEQQQITQHLKQQMEEQNKELGSVKANNDALKSDVQQAHRRTFNTSCHQPSRIFKVSCHLCSPASKVN
jgi:hypothetical protein